MKYPIIQNDIGTIAGQVDIIVQDDDIFEMIAAGIFTFYPVIENGKLIAFSLSAMLPKPTEVIPPEPSITINGHYLTTAQAMTVRVALGSSPFDEDTLGEVGILYNARLREVLRYIHD